MNQFSFIYAPCRRYFNPMPFKFRTSLCTLSSIIIRLMQVPCCLTISNIIYDKHLQSSLVPYIDAVSHKILLLFGTVNPTNITFIISIITIISRLLVYCQISLLLLILFNLKAEVYNPLCIQSISFNPTPIFYSLNLLNT